LTVKNVNSPDQRYVICDGRFVDDKFVAEIFIAAEAAKAQKYG
jgi:hypothetical protein